MDARASESRPASAPGLVADLAPTPDGGALVVEVECQTSVRARRGKRHPVTIEPDWSVSTPHDLDAERIAVAFGGYTSCLSLVDTTIPAFRESLALLTRRTRPRLLPGRGGSWRLPEDLEVSRCCVDATFRTPAKVLRHLRSIDHLVGAFEAPAWQLRQVYSAAEQVWGSWEGRSRVGPEVSSLVREPAGVSDLWHAGIRPDEIIEMAATADMVDEALPVAFYLAMAYGEADPDWFRRALRHRPDPDVAAWLAGLSRREQIGDGDTWGRWLALGLPRNDVRTLVREGTDPDRVEELARATGWREGLIARNLAAWAALECRPGIAEFEVLARLQVTGVPVSAAVIDGLIDEIGSLVHDSLWAPVALSRTEIGVMYAVLGNRVAVLNAVNAGVRGVHGLDRHVLGEELR